MKRIPLTKGKEALVDDKDYEYLIQWKWSTVGNGAHQHYACCTIQYKMALMHRMVAARAWPDATAQHVDHKDGNGLNNRRNNLRIATYSQNGANRGPNRNNTSGFKGVVLHKPTGRWRADLMCRGKRYYLGYYDTPIEAARAYNEAAAKHFGEFASLNNV